MELGVILGNYKVFLSQGVVSLLTQVHTTQTSSAVTKGQQYGLSRQDGKTSS